MSIATENGSSWYVPPGMLAWSRPWRRRACRLRKLREAAMPLFIIERNFAERLELTRDETLKTLDVNDDLGLRWLYSFLSADKRKTYCLYEAPNAQALREHAQRLGIPADSIIEVSQIQPEILVQT